jgi:hypothetical protein
MDWLVKKPEFLIEKNISMHRPDITYIYDIVECILKYGPKTLFSLATEIKLL